MLIVLGLLIGIGAAEAWVRIARPFPPVQMIRGFGLHSVDGVPVWEQTSDRQNRICVEQHPERTRILFFGSSITYGNDLSAAQTFSVQLEARLNELRPDPGFCVLNFAQSGFSFEQKYAVARMEVARYKPRLILWEDWVEWMDYTLIGETAYGTAGFRVRADGFIGLRGVPDIANRFFLLHSHFYEYLTLMVGEKVDRAGDEEEARVFASERLGKVPELAKSVGAKLVFYLAPPLDRSFAETVASAPAWHRVILDFAKAHDVPAYPLQRELIDQDYLDLRMDPCCHYNAKGHQALVPIMQRIVFEQLAGPDARS